MAPARPPQPELIVANVAKWRAWLRRNHAKSDGVWLIIAKKGTTEPTSLRYDEALEEALCQGWIDGQVKSRDDGTFQQRWTPRRARSIWSARNVGIATRLIEEGRMQPAGLAQIEQARADGRWDRAYGGSAQIEMPDDLAAALEANPAAKATFETLNRQNRYAVLFRVTSAYTERGRAQRIAGLVDKLSRGATPYPQ